jgi:predicted DCC family thiol-disulfide oxidoreductase YuxK
MAPGAETGTSRPILLFDGICNLCNGVTQYVIRRDPLPGKFLFATLQSEAGQHLLRRHGLPTDSLDSFVIIENDRAYSRSTAGLRVLRRLGFPWSLLYPLILVPGPMRDLLYDWIARRRYRWFGKRDVCMMPTPDIQQRFLS